jgi:hypothetical protein
VKLKLAIPIAARFPACRAAEAPAGPDERPYKSVVYKHEKLTTHSIDKEGKPVDWPQEVFAAFVDLTDPNVHVRVSRGGEDPDGPGEWQTTLMPPTKVAEREGFDLVVNGDFFSAFNTKDAEGEAALKQFTGGRPAKVTGPAVTDGHKWGPPSDKKRGVFFIDGRGKPAVAERKGRAVGCEGSHRRQRCDRAEQRERRPSPATSRALRAGGRIRAPAVGIRDGGKTLVLVVIDGRKKDVAIGMSLRETAEIMMKYGCTDAVNLDGGGSSMLGIRDPKSGKMEIKNHPSDGRERSRRECAGGECDGEEEVTFTPLSGTHFIAAITASPN